MVPDRQLPLFLLTAAVFIILLVPSLVQEGMFMDGLIYATVAKNLAHGIGTVWNMKVSDTFMSDYHDQPPLALWIQALFFKVFGDSMYTERLYSFLTAVITAWLIIRIWKYVFADTSIGSLGWLPVLLWIVTPFCFWSYANNMLENTMSIFVLAAVYFIFKAAHEKKLIPVILASLCLFLASLTKGIQGTFPVVLPFIMLLVQRNQSLSTTCKQSMLLLFIPLIIYLLLILSPVIRQSLYDYYQARLVNTFTNPVFEEESRWHLLKKLAEGLAIPVSLCLWIAAAVRWKMEISRQARQWSVVFLLLALSGTLPLMVTKEQRRFYLVTPLPFYSLAMASLIAPSVNRWIHRLSADVHHWRKLSLTSAGLIVSALVVSACFAGKTRRDHNLLYDVSILAQHVSPPKAMGRDKKLADHYSLHLYLARYYNISLYAYPDTLMPLLVMDKASVPDEEHQYRELKSDLRLYRLFQRLSP
jgi:4-amino-4-deoxy-L-arabinose transferase-like glycosyltransferase